MDVARDDFFTSKEPLPESVGERTTSGLIPETVPTMSDGPESTDEMDKAFRTAGGSVSPLFEDATGCRTDGEAQELFQNLQSTDEEEERIQHDATWIPTTDLPEF